MSFAQPPRRDRIGGAVAAIVVQGLLAYALILGLGVRITAILPDELKTFAVPPRPVPSPIEKVVPKPRESHKRAGKAAPPNLKSKASEIVAPVVPVPIPPPVLAAAKPGTGFQATTGAAPVAGPGTGAGGQGNGTGSGGEGDGDGDGGDETPPRQTGGRIKDSDYPHAPGEAGVSGTVEVQFTVTEHGRVTDCSVTHSSGSAILDSTTCRLITQRFRYAPSRDAAGHAVESTIIENHTWVAQVVPAGGDDGRRPR